MWRSLWRSFDRFSLQYFKYIINELRGIKVIDRSNRELVIDILQSIVEIVTYGDKHDPLIFECFMEYQVMAEFVRLVNISRNSRLEGPLLQYLSIMIQNIESEHAIYYCFSNDYINNIIAHQYKFDGVDLAPYYVSFLRAVSSKINRDTLCLLVKVDGDTVIHFPLYSEALKFAQHGEKMIQTAVRALSLCIYNVCDDMVFHFVTTHPASDFFIDLVQNLKEQCVCLDTVIHNKEETSFYEKQKRVFSESDKIVDDLYYLKDILGVGNSQLSKVVAENLLKFFICPQLSSLTVANGNNDSSISPITSLYSVSRLLQVVGEKSLINVTAGVILHPYMRLRREDTSKLNVNGNNHYDENASVSNCVSEVEATVCSALDFLEAEKSAGDDFLALMGYNPSSDDLVGCIIDNVAAEMKLLSWNRNGILAAISSDNPLLLLGSLFLLLILLESKDLNYMFSKIIRSIVLQDIKIVDTLLEVLANHPPQSVQICLQTGWFLRKLLTVQEMKLSHDSLMLLNTSFEQSREWFRKELAGCWFDYIPDTLKNEWKSCKAALEESSHRKDPIFALELVIHQQNRNDGATSPSLTWQRMVDAVKDFVLHVQLKAFFLKRDLPEVPVLDLECSSTSESGRTHTSDHSSANFGSEVALGSAFPCRIAFSNAGLRDIYVIPVAKGNYGKLLLMEKHPFRNQKGVVIAIAPLPGTSPRVDEEHPTWLHLQIREFDPKFDLRKARGHPSKKSSHVADGRWTLGFSSTEACMVARSMILDEISKQRSFVEKQLEPLLQSDDIVH